MSKRGRRRSSRRRKSSSGKSSSPYNKQDTSCSCVRRDETRNDHVDQNVLSGSEKKRKCSNKEEEKEEDAQMNLLSVPNIVYMKTTEDKEKGMKITTSVSVSDMKDSFPKITLQLSHELSPENPPATSLSDTVGTKGFGLRLNVEMKERTELTGCAVKSDLRFVYGDDCEEPPNDEPLERPSQPWTREAGSPPLAQEDSRYLHTSTVWESPSVSQCFGGRHRRASMGPHPPLSPHATRKRLHRNVETDHCWNFSPIQQPSAHLAPLKSTAVDDVAFSGINQRRFHAAPTVSSDSGSRFPAAPLFPGCDRHGCALQRPQGNVSLVGDYVRYPKRRSWIQTSGKHRGCLFPMKRCHTFPGMSEALGVMHEELVLPYHGCVLSLIMNSLPFNTLRLANIHQEKIQLSSFGSRKPQCPQSMWSSKSIPDDQDMKICHLKHCGPQTLRRYHHQGDSRTCRELEGEHLSPEQLTEKLRLLNMRVVHPALRHPLRCPPAGEQEGASVEPQPNPTRLMQLSSGSADGSYAGNHTPASVEQTSTFPPATPVQSNQRSEDPNDLLDTEKQRREEKLKGQQRASCSAKNPADKQEEKMAKVEETGHQGPSRLSIDSSQHLRPVDGSVSDHWAVKRKLFRENKQWSSAGGSSITSDMTEEQASEDGPSLDTTPQDEDRGFYAETFYSSAWVYQGDDSSGVIPPSLNSRTRAVSIRERTVKVSKGTGEYPWGFRIQFSKPIVVTEVDTNGAAEEAGLMVGDYVLAVNGTDVTSIPHSEAANLARQGPDLLTLTIGSDIARYPSSPRPACRGYLYKRTQSGLIKGWRKRWFVLTHECCLYYYRHRRDEGQQRPLQALRLEGAEVRPDTSLGKPFVFKCCPQAATRVFFFSATSSQEMKRWLEAMEKAIRPITQNHVWEDVTRHNCSLPPLAVKNPECLGLLHKLDRSRDTWVQHYCILKDGCLSFYSGIRATHAQGGIYLQGYTVKEQPYGSKKSSIELKPPSDEFKTFYFCAENATENKRWILALKASVKKWLPLHRALQDYMSRPPEETRM